MPKSKYTRAQSTTTYTEAKDIIARNSIKSKKEYYELCEYYIQLCKDPETRYKGQFTNWVDYLSIPYIYYDIDTCREQVKKYLAMPEYSELRKHWLDITYIIIELCKIDASFPPSEFWTEYYNVPNITELINISPPYDDDYIIELRNMQLIK